MILALRHVSDTVRACKYLFCAHTMVSVTVAAAKKTPLARDLPFAFDFPGKGPDAVTIADVKHALATKYPEVSSTRPPPLAYTYHARCCPSSTHRVKSSL